MNMNRLIEAGPLESQFENLVRSWRGTFSGPAYADALERLQKAPAVDAVEIPNCEKCYYNGDISHWDQCEHCIGNTYRNNNFVSKENIDSDGNRRTDNGQSEPGRGCS